MAIQSTRERSIGLFRYVAQGLHVSFALVGQGAVTKSACDPKLASGFVVSTPDSFTDPSTRSVIAYSWLTLSLELRAKHWRPEPWLHSSPTQDSVAILAVSVTKTAQSRNARSPVTS